MAIEDKIKGIANEYQAKLDNSKSKYQKEIERFKAKYEKEQREITKWYGKQIVKASKSEVINDMENAPEKVAREKSQDDDSTRLSSRFFSHSPKRAGKNLVGKILRTEYYNYIREGVISEVAILSGDKEDNGLCYAPGRIHLYSHGNEKALVISTEKEGKASGIMITKIKDTSNCHEIITEDVCKSFRIDDVLEGKPINNLRVWIYGEKSKTKGKLDMETAKRIPKCTAYYKIK